MKIFWNDTETSGLDPLEHGIIQLAYIIEIDGVEKERDILYSNCLGKKYNQKALAVNGFTVEQVDKFPSPHDMFLKLSMVLGKYVDKFDKNDKFTPGGYNNDFDMRFLRQLFIECGEKYFGSWFSFGIIDPVQIMRFLSYCGLDLPTGAKLTEIAHHFGVLRENAHDALVDVEMTIDVVRKFQEFISVEGK